MTRAVRLGVLFWWFALLDLDGHVVQRHARFLTRDDCEWGRTLYERIVEASGREDRTVGRCVEQPEAAR